MDANSNSFAFSSCDLCMGPRNSVTVATGSTTTATTTTDGGPLTNHEYCTTDQIEKGLCILQDIICANRGHCNFAISRLNLVPPLFSSIGGFEAKWSIHKALKFESGNTMTNLVAESNGLTGCLTFKQPRIDLSLLSLSCRSFRSQCFFFQHGCHLQEWPSTTRCQVR